MFWSEITARPTDRKLREFAAAGAAVCCGLAAWQVVSGNGWLAGGCLLAALVAGGIGIWMPRWLSLPFQFAMIVTFPLAWAMSLLVLALLFYGVITPLGLLFRLFGRDALHRQVHARHESYWQRKPTTADSRRYLRQY